MTGVFSAPNVADYHLETHLMEWKTLPTGERVSSAEKMQRQYMQSWKRRTAEASAEQWRAKRAAIASNSHGRKLSNSRSVVAVNATTEVNALLAFRSAIPTDPTGALTNWTLENGASHCSTWKGVSCDEWGQVTEIELRNLGLKGTISPSIGDLAHLSSLNLSGSSLWGAIPSSLGRCRNLSMLDLSHNSLGGKVPAELFTLPRLEILWLSNNDISDRLPEVVEANGCQSLTNLWIDNNEISGTLPSSLSKCQNLEMVSLTNNELNGGIPAALGVLHQLQQLWLDSNEFSGHIPSELGLLTKLQWLILEKNQFSGQIPPSFGTLSQLQVLNLKRNKLTGPIPPFLGNCTSLVNLMLGYNRLTGTIPKELGDLSNIEEFNFENNWYLTDSIPDFLSKCSKLRILFLGMCNFTSISPEIWSMKSLEHLIVFSNNLIGELPLEVGNCTSLNWLDLGWNNQLNGSIPPTLGLLTNLSTLSLMVNSFTGRIPPEVGNLKLRTLMLASNGLNGTILEDLGRCVSLTHLDLSGNQFTGGIPKFLGSFSRLVTLDLSYNTLNDDAVALSRLKHCPKLETLLVRHNNIYGSLREDFYGWPNLKYLSVAHNNLTGGIPLSFGCINSSLVLADFSQNKFTGRFPVQVDGSHLSELRILLFSHNEIGGSIPSWFGNLKSLQVLDLSFNQLTGSIPPNFGNLDGYKVQIDDSSSSPDAVFTLDQWFIWKFAETLYSYDQRAAPYMDLSSNALQGEISVGLAELVRMQNLNLSNNRFDGNLWAGVQNLKALETLDVSQNNLSGPLPPELPTSLRTFKVFLNNFSGAIPVRSKYGSYSYYEYHDSSSYLPGNPGLCGNVIQRPCEIISLPGFGIGAAIGFCIVATTTLFWAPARAFVFGAVEKRRAAAEVQPAYGLFRPRF